MNRDMTVGEALKVLHLAPGASGAEVTAAYRELIRSVHPDLAPGSADQEELAASASRANRAKAVLCRLGTGQARVEQAPPQQPAGRQTSSPRSSGSTGEGGGWGRCSQPATRRGEPHYEDPILKVANQSPFGRQVSFWSAVGATGLVVVGALLRVFQFWNGTLADTSWGSAEAAKSIPGVLIAALLGIAGVWLITRVRTSGAALTLMFAVVLYSSFSEVHIRLNWAETSLLFGGVVVLPIYLLVVPAVRRFMLQAAP